MTDRLTDAIECFHELNGELAGKTDTHGELAKWVIGKRLSSHACSIYVISFRLQAALH